MFDSKQRISALDQRSSRSIATRRLWCGLSQRRFCSLHPIKRWSCWKRPESTPSSSCRSTTNRPPKALSHSSTESFYDVSTPNSLSSGEDFHFGRHRDGNVDLLRKIGAESDFDVKPLELIPRVDGVGEPVSSTAIRRALAGGDVTRANEMLGHIFEARGSVVTGDQRGRLLGFPTANVEVPNTISLPADGVYAGWYERPSGELHPCAINLGRRPTFYEHADSSLLEAHLLDFDDDLYGEQARVKFTHFLRSERKFDGIEALKEQLDLDTAHATELLR